MNVPAFASFEEAGRAILRFLHERFAFTLWAITRVESNNLILLQAEDHGYGLKPSQIMYQANIDNQVETSIGVAICLPATDLKEAFRLAVQQMDAPKRSKQDQG